MYKKIYYYFTVEKRNDGVLDRFTYYFIQLDTITIKIKSLGSILDEKASVSVVRPDIGFIISLRSFIISWI